MTQPAVVVERATFIYPACTTPALDDVSLTLDRGSFTLVAGATGSGKSTLMKLLAGWIPRYASGKFVGTVSILGETTSGELQSSPSLRAGLVLQSPDDQICTTSVEAEVAFGLENLALPPDEIGRRIEDALRFCGLAGFNARHPQQLSGGQKQRLVIAAILAMQPEVIVLDEPLSQLDPRGSEELIALLAKLKERGTTLVVAEHRLTELSNLADQLLLIDRGKVAIISSLNNTASFSPEPAATADLRPFSHSPLSPPTILATIDNLALHYRRAPRPVWENISFSIHPGDRIAIVGNNGAGKSTLLQVLAGVMKPTSGAITHDQHDNTFWGLVFQNPDSLLFATSAADEIGFALRNRSLSVTQRNRYISAFADRFALADLLERSSLALSQGQRLRLAVAAVCSANPRVLLLDEPTTGQDPQQVVQLMQTLSLAVAKNASKHVSSNALDTPLGRLQAMIFSTHDLHVVERFATRVLVLADGRLAADATIAQFREDTALRALAGWSTSTEVPR